MTDIERQTLINQYEILKNTSNIQNDILYYEQQVKFLTSGYIFLFDYNLQNCLEVVVSEKNSILVMDILQLHDVITVSSTNNKQIPPQLGFDFNNDHPYRGLAEDAINSQLFLAYSNFKVIDTHGSKNIKDHQKQIDWWKSNGQKYLLDINDLNIILDYHKLP